MNVVMIMSGGVGKRFGSALPKQYLKINGKAVIDYVIEKVKTSCKTDKIVIVMDEKYKDKSSYINDEDFIIAPNGKERYDSIKNGFDAIKEIGGCDNVLICDAVAPMIYPELIDYYFDLLKSYDSVITAQKITGSLGNYDYDPLDREKYYITQSPEAFKFDLITKYFDPNFKSQELAWQLPVETKKFLNFKFKNNLKLTYNFELDYLAFLLNDQKLNSNYEFSDIIDKDFFKTKGIKDFLLRTEPLKTECFIENTYMVYDELKNKYGPFKNFSINQESRYGIVAQVQTMTQEEFVVKFIPEFLNRYENEKLSYQTLSSEYMCEMLGFDDDNRILFLKKLNGATQASFDDNINLTDFFERVFKTMVAYENNDKKTFYDELNDKYKNAENLPFLARDLKDALKKSIDFYDDNFKNSKLYFLHGDLRMNNILKDDDKYYAIDPIGYVAPSVFETCRFIIDDVISNKNFSIGSRLNILANYFSKWFSKEEILISTYIYTSFIAYNSTFENKDDNQTKRYIDLLGETKKMILK